MIKKIFGVFFASWLCISPSFLYAKEEQVKLHVEVDGPGTIWIDDQRVQKEAPLEQRLDRGAILSILVSGQIESMLINGQTQSAFEEKEIVLEDDTTIKIAFQEAENELEKKGIFLDIENMGMIPAHQEAILESYQRGEEAHYVQERFKAAKKTGLIDYVDDHGFLTPQFGKMFSWISLDVPDAILLKKIETPETILEPMELILETKGYSVIDSAHFTAHVSPGYISNGLWRLSNGKLAYCAQAMMAEPMINDATSDPFLVDNAALRKALYYGHDGPGNILPSKGWDVAKQIVATNDFCSMAYTGVSLGNQAANGWHWNNWIRSAYEEIMAKPDPIQYGYVAYMVKTPGSGINWAGQHASKQNLAFGDYEPTGSLQIKKSSSNPSISQHNPNYSFHRAKYGLYSDPKATQLVGEFILDANGVSNTISNLKYKTFYLKELSAPQGFALDPTIYSITISKSTTQFEVKDLPKINPVSLLLKKVDQQTELSKPQGSGSLQGAEYRVDYYADAKKAPIRSWVLRSDTNGEIYLKDAYKVSGDPFYTNSLGQPGFPIGTIKIQEIKAPSGYLLDPEIREIQIRDAGNVETLLSFKEIEWKEAPISLTIFKHQKGMDVPIADTRFIHTLPDGSQNELVSDENGRIDLAGLAFGEHRIEEAEAKNGYVLDPSPFVFVAKESGIEVKECPPCMEWDGRVLKVENAPTSFSIKVHKQNRAKTALEGAEFTLYKAEDPSEAFQIKTSDENGDLAFSNLEEGKEYILKETKAPPGYRLPLDEAHSIKVETIPAQNKVNVWIDGILQEGPHFDWEQKQLNMLVYNQEQMVLPNTALFAASSWGSLLVLASIGMIYKKRKDIGHE